MTKYSNYTYEELLKLDDKIMSGKEIASLILSENPYILSYEQKAWEIDESFDIGYVWLGKTKGNIARYTDRIEIIIL